MSDITRRMDLADGSPHIRLHTYDDWAALALSANSLNVSIHMSAAEVRKLAEFFSESAAKLEKVAA